MLRLVLVSIVALEATAFLYLLQSRDQRVAPPLVRANTRAEAIAAKVAVLPEAISRDDSDAWLAKASMLRLYGFFPEADYCFRMADANDALTGDGLHQWATCLEQMGALDRAEQTFRSALNRGTARDANSWGALALLHLRREDIKQAEIAFQKAGPLPHLVPHHLRLLLRTDRAEEAKQLISKVDSQMNRYAEFRIMKMRCALALNDPKFATVAAEMSQRGELEIPSTDPGKAEAGRIDFVMGDSLHVSQARHLSDAGEFQAALKVMRQVTEISNWEHDTVLRADLEARVGDPSTVPSMIAQAIEKSGASPQLMRVLGDAYGQMGRLDDARNAWEQGLELYPTTDLHFRLARLDAMQGRNASAQRHDGLARFLEGRAAYLADDIDLAYEKLVEATQLAPQEPHAWFYLARVQQIRGDHDAARASLQQTLELHPNHGRAIAMASRRSD